MFKTCSKCKLQKETIEFSKDKGQKDGLYPSCKACKALYNKTDRVQELRKDWRVNNKQRMRENNYKKSYGTTIEDYDRMLKEQKGKCAICSSTETKNKNYSYFAVDHCHKTGKIRGLLCDKCNTALGSFQDNIKVLSKAIEYLKQNMEEYNE
jgi:hypothetical protein